MSRQEFGDWQTPPSLAEAVVSKVGSMMPKPAVVIEPTCGTGAFLVAASSTFPDARLVGFELKEEYLTVARRQSPRADVRQADFFSIKWERELSALPGYALIIGNPPWVTNSVLGSLGSENLPAKTNIRGLSGMEARTGKSNFDVSEWMILRLLEALRGREATVALLCKSTVARRVVEHVSRKASGVAPCGIWRIDAMKHFDAAVDAVLFVCRTVEHHTAGTKWPMYESLSAEQPTSFIAVVDGELVADADAFASTAHLAGNCEPEWRSGIKHDCSRVMELSHSDDGLENGFGERVVVEPDFVYPLLKSSDVASGATAPRRAVIVPQRALGEDTKVLRSTAPKLWGYLSEHADPMRARKSSIYLNQPEFAIFGIGAYSFSQWKVAISGLYKRTEFRVVGPVGGRPVMLDDTCYFLPYESERDALESADTLNSSLAQRFLAARVFWDAKRPITKAILQRLDIAALQATLRLDGRVRRTRRQLSLPL